MRASYRYQLADSKNAVAIYYICYLAAIAALFVLMASSAAAGGGGHLELGGINIASSIFLFVAGIVLFKEPLGMLLQNGVSRKTIQISRLLAILTIAGGMAVIDELLHLAIGGFLVAAEPWITYTNLLKNGYPLHVGGLNPAQVFFEGVLFNVTMYAGFTALGLFIGGAYYRMNKALKVAVSVGVPALFIVVLPWVDVALTSGQLTRAIGRAIDFCLGTSAQIPYAAMITFAVSFAVWGGLAWLLTRRAPIQP